MKHSSHFQTMQVSDGHPGEPVRPTWTLKSVSEEIVHLNVKFMLIWNDFATENLPNNSKCDAPFACKTCHHFFAHQAVTKIASISLLHMSSNKVRSLAVHLGGRVLAKYTLPFFTIFTTNTLHCTQKGNNPTAHSTCVQTHKSEIA